MIELWNVPFREYLEFEGVKEGINEIKKLKKAREKEQMQQRGVNGTNLEIGITKIVSDCEGFEVKVLSPQMDVGFGADLQVTYTENEKQFSFFVDITNKPKKIVRYFTLDGQTGDIDDAFCYKTEYFDVRFGFKEKHYDRFFYEKPIVVMHVTNYTPTTGLALSHIANIEEIMKSLNSLLYRMGYGARASQLVRPNPKRFYSDYKNRKR